MTNNQNIAGQVGSDGNVTNFNVKRVLTAGEIVARRIVAGRIDGLLASTGVIPGTYTFSTVTIGSDGRITSAESGVIPSPPPPPSGGITCVNPPTVTDTLPVWNDLSGNFVKQQSTTQLARTAGPLSASGVSTILTNVCLGGNTNANSIAGGSLTTGNSNTLIGTGAGTRLTSGTSNVMIGLNAGSAATTNVNASLILGLNAGDALTSSFGDIIMGVGAVGTTTTTGGSNVLLGSGVAASLTGTNNVVLGTTAGTSISGISNVVLGTDAGKLISGTANVAIGFEAGSTLTTGNSNLILQSRSFPTTQVDQGFGNILIGGGARAGPGAAVSRNIIIAPSDTLADADSKERCILLNSSLSASGTLTPAANDTFGVRVNNTSFTTQFVQTASTDKAATNYLTITIGTPPVTYYILMTTVAP